MGWGYLQIAARAALKRKKQHEHSLDQTTAQIATLEQQIYSIEAANINQETLKAMQKAGKAMKEIHGGLTIDKVDETMYVVLVMYALGDDIYTDHLAICVCCRDQLREQHALGEEIATAITSAPIGETVDADELEEELVNMEQEALDDKMLKTGTVPVGDTVHRLGNGEGKSNAYTLTITQRYLLTFTTVTKYKSYNARRREEEKEEVRVEDEDEEAELAKLQAEMAM